MLLNYLSSILLAYVLHVSKASIISVETQYGIVGGFPKISADGRKYIAFEGIPYAKPPLGSLRFEPPKPFGKWNGVLTANITYLCSQVLYLPHGLQMGQEDCLYLNVYIPKSKINQNSKMPVVVNFHGGSFMMLGPKVAAGELYIMDRDVIYVNMNYRLGVFGFLSTEDEVVPGNMGLKDQNLALRWVKENIDAFGGNPDSITIVGVSAGAASVHYHYISPLSKGLFARGISQSGSVFNMWALVKNPAKNFKTLGNLLKCPEGTREIVNCLKKLPVNEILTAEKKLFKVLETFPPTLFGPVVEKGENSFLPDHPYKLLAAGQMEHVPWINSYVKDEGIFMFLPFVYLNKVHELDRHWEEMAPYTLYFEETAKSSDWRKIARDLRSYYLGDTKITKTNTKIIKLFTDRYFLYDGLEALKLHANNSQAPVYFYRYFYDDGKGMFGVKGVSHGDDAKLTFNPIMMPRKLASPTSEVKAMLLDLIYEYATKGTPTLNGEEMPVFKGSTEDLVVNIFSSTNITRTPLGEFDNQAFWDELPIIENKKLFQKRMG
ncbi:venom carboxylesterase-6-like [Agrilus planipennis]|uniref:Carboxylic ester hydrolase n=1 Tax=Agrilus planipennis TaxID=224129 RepID=A0A1W4X939_AGRPL|nr:venom carboxylesterase-6-like [Agrilus planipennis]